MFYANYIKLCNSIGKSPSAVAEEIGIKRSTVTRWKNGNSQTDANIQKVADYFKVSVAFLKGIEDEKESAAPETGSGASEIDSIFEALSPSNQTKLIELARLFLDDQRKKEGNQ